MSHKPLSVCLYCSLFMVALLLFQETKAQYNFTKVDKWMEDNVTEMGGRMVMLVFKDGKIIYNHAENDMSNKQKFISKAIAKRRHTDSKKALADYDENTKLSIASCSKWLSAALVMTFADEGQLKLADTIGKWLPVMSANGKGSITIGQCLSHNTGIKPGNNREGIKSSLKALTMNEEMNAIALMPVEAAPGKGFHYSSIGLQIAAAVIEKISGKPFETLFKERIAMPCDMPNTDFGFKPVPLAAGGALSTATDYLHFLQMILANGMYNNRQVLKKESVILMQQNHVAGVQVFYSPAQAGGWGYGLGEWVMEVPATGQIRSNAVTSPGLFGSFPWVDNRLQYAAVLITFNLRNKGRGEKYRELKTLTDEAITRH